MTKLVLRFEGQVSLREDYIPPNKINYYAVLDGAVSATAISGTARVKDLTVPIVKERYDELKKELSDSLPNRSYLFFKGNLEISVQGACIN